MSSRAHPLRRSYGLELALGGLCALAATWALIGRSSGARGRSPIGAESPVPLEESEPAPLAAPGSELASGPARERPGVKSSTPASTPRADPPAERPAPEPHELEVLVLDAWGQPVPGVPLGLNFATVRPAGSGGVSVRPLPITDEHGRSSVPLQAFEPPRAGRERYRCVLRALLPLRDGPSLDFGTLLPEPGLVTLVLPPAGRLRVHARGEGDEPVPDKASIYLTTRAPSGETLSAMAEVRAGQAEFACVELHSTLDLKGVFDDQRGPATWLTVAGPVAPGETVECELRFKVEWPLLRFRILERGEPLRHANVRLNVMLPPLSPQVASLESDAEGRVELRLMGARESSEERRMEVLVEQPERLGAELVLPFELERGCATDLGDIVLRPRPK